jgi:NTE family protein
LSNIKENLEYFCILSGGGIRGTAYIGVFRALEKIGVNIKGLAGASVGAIFASFYAIGYTTDEIEEIFLSVNYETFRDINLSLNKGFGLWKGDNIQNWVKDSIEKKFYGKNYEKEANLPVKFKDIEKDLVIIATDISTGCFKEFSKYTTPDESVATAIRSSISLPGIFKPTWIDESCIIDGDIIRGLPFWSFSDNLNPKDTRILEFRLEGSHSKKDLETTVGYLNAVINTASNISTDFIMNQYSQNDKYDYIKIDSKNTMPVDFSIKKDKKLELAQIGFDTTLEYFKSPLKNKKTKLVLLYQEFLEEFKNIRDYIKKQKMTNLKLSINKTLLLTMKNKHLIEEELHNECISVLEEILSNITISKFFKRTVLKNQGQLIQNLETILFDIMNNQIELKQHLNILGKLLL